MLFKLLCGFLTKKVAKPCPIYSQPVALKALLATTASVAEGSVAGFPATVPGAATA